MAKRENIPALLAEKVPSHSKPSLGGATCRTAAERNAALLLYQNAKARRRMPAAMMMMLPVSEGVSRRVPAPRAAHAMKEYPASIHPLSHHHW